MKHIYTRVDNFKYILDGVVDVDFRRWVSNGATIVGDNVWNRAVFALNKWIGAVTGTTTNRFGAHSQEFDLDDHPNNMYTQKLQEMPICMFLAT